MPLPKPTLDNRRYDQLVGEGRALIPRLAPAWTDQNASDPGITLLELGAWLAEQNIYRFDRLSDPARRAFMRLVGIEPRMPGVARGVVSIVNSNALGVTLPARMQLGDSALRPWFETTHPLFASPARLVSVMTGKRPLSAPTGGPAFLESDASAANAGLQPFDAFGARPRPGHALYLGFDRALDAAGETLSLHVWTDHWRADAATRDALTAEYAALTAHAKAHCTPPDWRLHYHVRTLWEFQGGAGHWLPLAGVDDETRALTLTGFVRFKAPEGHEPAAPGGPFFIRCRVVHGRFECAPRLVHVGFNAAPCEHALSIDERRVGLARGHAHAVFELGEAQVVAGTMQLRVDDGAGDVQTDWQEAPDFERAGPGDHVFSLDPERALIQSGDGLRGAILPARHELFAAFRTGGGPYGNLSALSLVSLPPNPHNTALAPALGTLGAPLAVVQYFQATDGAVRESLEAGQARAFDLASAVDKAVTVADIERLALDTPAVPVARVRAVAGIDPALPCYPAPGVVTLIVIPPCPRRAPMPSRALLDAVERYLEPRRLVTSEIHAVAPRYKRVGVDATLHLACEADPSTVLREAAARVSAFFDPLGGGPDGSGWPFGRTVYRTEVMALLADVTGVSQVSALSLRSGTASTGGGDVGGDGALCGNVVLCPNELVVSGRQRLVLESDTATHLKRSDAHECQSV